MKKTTKIFRATALLGLTVLLLIGFMGCKQNNPTSNTGSEDKTPPSEVTNFKAKAGVSKVDLSWTNPSDKDLHQVEITASPAEGTLKNPVYLTAKAGENASFTVEGLVNGKEYSFTVKAVDKSSNKSSGVSKTITLKEPSIKAINLPVYNDALQGKTVEIGIYGENLDVTETSDFTVEGNAGGTKVKIKIENAFIATLEYTLPSDSVVGKTVKVTLNSVTKSATFTAENDKYTDMQVVIPSGEEVVVAYDSQSDYDYKNNPQFGKWKIYKDGVLQEKSVTIKPYSIGRTEVSYKLWKEVYDWATGDVGGCPEI